MCARGCVSRACACFRFRFLVFATSLPPLFCCAGSMAVSLGYPNSRVARLGDAGLVGAFRIGFLCHEAPESVAISADVLMFCACSGFMPNPCAGWRITGMVTSCFVTPISPTRCRMRPSSGQRNWVSIRPPPSNGLSSGLGFSLPACFLPYCVVAHVQFLEGVLLQVSWFGEDIPGPTPHPIALSGPRATSCFPSSKCIADGSCRRTAAIYIL